MAVVLSTAAVDKPEVILCFCATKPRPHRWPLIRPVVIWISGDGKKPYRTGRFQDGSVHSSSYFLNLKRRCKSFALSVCVTSPSLSLLPVERHHHQEMVTDRVLPPVAMAAHKNSNENEATPWCQMWQEESWLQQLCSQTEESMTQQRRDLDALGSRSLRDGVTALIFGVVWSSDGGRKRLSSRTTIWQQGKPDQLIPFIKDPRLPVWQWTSSRLWKISTSLEINWRY